MRQESEKKQPYIPLYIGDWEADCNILSLEVEAAWLKIIFKMWKNGKSGIYKTSTKDLQNLWKTDTKGVQNIIFVLGLNDICRLEKNTEKDEISGETHHIIVFINRRMEKEAKISEIRTKAVQNRYKTDTNTLQPSDIDNDIDINISVLNNINVEFEKFWDLYAKKVGDGEKIKKKWESLKDPERTLIMERLPAYISATPDKQFRKNPYTYLNQKSWNDEIIKPAQNGTYNGSASKNNKSASTHALAARLAGLNPGKS